jgi:hypothetical protein
MVRPITLSTTVAFDEECPALVSIDRGPVSAVGSRTQSLAMMMGAIFGVPTASCEQKRKCYLVDKRMSCVGRTTLKYKSGDETL